MNRILACILAILSVIGAIIFIDYDYMNDCKKICGMSEVKDVTENEKSSFVGNIVQCEKTTLEDEEKVEKEECNQKVEDFEYKCDEKENIEKPDVKEEKPQEKTENTVHNPSDKEEKTSNNVEKPLNTAEKFENIIEKPLDNVEKSENTVEKPSDKVEKTENIVHKPTDKVEPEQPSNIDEKIQNKPSPKWGITLGDYNGLTYYSQIDDRWKNDLYTSTGNTRQTIGSSGCGPTAVAMVVSSIKGNVTPPQIAEAFVKNGYRSPNNGTYWSAYRAVAEEFGINYAEIANFEKALELLRNNYYVIVSCGKGLFTTGGHYVVLVGIEENTLKIYDPYLYSGKFNIPSRRGKVVVEGNTVYCSIKNFKKYSSYKNFFCYENKN